MSDYDTWWLLPDTYTGSEVTPVPGEAVFPQTLVLDLDSVPCGRWLQHDWYNADPSEVTADGMLVWTEDGPEDHAIYVTHEFVYTGACVEPSESPTPTPTPPEPPVLNCPPGTVPGWLDEQGNPTSCISDNPTPGSEQPSSTPSPLAETGVSVGDALMYALALVVFGTTIVGLVKKPK